MIESLNDINGSSGVFEVESITCLFSRLLLVQPDLEGSNATLAKLVLSFVFLREHNVVFHLV